MGTCAGRCCSGRSEAAAGTKYWAVLLRQIGARGLRHRGTAPHAPAAATRP